MQNMKDYIDKIQKLTATMRQLQAELLVLKEYISRLIAEKEQQMNFSFEGEEDKYSIEPQQLVDLLKPYKVQE